ncbi:MAG: DUF72 domain-containing protein [Phaeodactylibacter sp.]|nr:DUF72 domain-containing protein [Phaeodactylibacter sp.]MCB9276977.1 DUF72 domain-containing protein [Lewinellaceae bacterium]
MEFGKLADISGVNFSLPTDSPGNARMLRALPKAGVLPYLYIGCTGWSMKEWAGRVYPPGIRSKDYLRYYSRQFNTIELNSTHYRIPYPATIRKWYEESEPDFRFCPKLPQTISHSRNISQEGRLIAQFCEAVEGLNEKLGHCFMQMPPYYDTSRLAELEKFFQAFPRHIPLALELRHESWFEPNYGQEALFEMLEQYGISTVITDVAGRRDILHMRLTNSTAMLRFVGNGLHPTDYSRADDWIKRMKKWYDAGLQQFFLFAHEPDNLLAPELAAYFLEKAQKELPGVRCRGPRLGPDGDEGQQMSLF